MIPWEVWYSHEQEDGIVVTDSAQLDSVLDRIATLSRPEWSALGTMSSHLGGPGSVLYIGFHVDVGALLYINTGDPIRHFSRGGGSPEGDPLLYMYMASADEFPPNAEIPAHIVRRAAHEFAETGRRPTCVEWQDWEQPDTDTESEYPGL
jgi:hypothetical protein